MPISLDATTKILKAKAIFSPVFARDRDKLARISNRTPRYGINHSSGKDEFQFWEIPMSSLEEIISQWDPEEIISTDSARKIIDRYRSKFVPILDLPFEELKVAPADGKELKDYQREYVTCSFQKQALLTYFSTGLGKTLAASMRAENIGFKNLLIIGPKKLRFNWRTEVRESLGKELLIYWAKTKAGREKLRKEIPKFNIFFASYETLDEFIQYGPPIDSIILDEIHIPSGEGTRVNKSVYKVLRSCQGPIQGLSATPMKKLEDLWNVLRLLDPEFAGSKKFFMDTYQEILATMPVKKRLPNGETRTFHIPIKVKSKNEDKLQEKLKGIMFPVRKSDHVDFKDGIEIIDCELTPRQSQMYNQALDDLRIELADKTLDTAHALTRMMRLLQISEAAFNLDDRYQDSGKLDFLKEDIASKGDEKLIFWSRFVPMTAEIQKLYPDKTVVYSGAVSDGLKDLAVWAFQGVTNKQDEEEFYRLKKYHPDFKFNPGEAQYFAATHSLKSGLGVNLHKSHICYFTSFDWDPTAVFQARDRISRLGQKFDTETYFLVASDTLERKALRLIINNYQVALNYLDGRGSISSKLNRDLLKLLY